MLHWQVREIEDVELDELKGCWIPATASGTVQQKWASLNHAIHRLEKLDLQIWNDNSETVRFCTALKHRYSGTLIITEQEGIITDLPNFY